MLFIFALPVMQVILFCLAIGRDPTGLRIAVVNKEMDYNLMECPFSDDCTFTNLSCRYLSHLNKTIVKVSNFSRLLCLTISDMAGTMSTFAFRNIMKRRS